MPDYICYVCNRVAEGGLDGLGNHLKVIHNIPLSKARNEDKFICGQDHCNIQFSLFKSMRDHISKNHCGVTVASCSFSDSRSLNQTCSVATQCDDESTFLDCDPSDDSDPDSDNSESETDSDTEDDDDDNGSSDGGGPDDSGDNSFASDADDPFEEDPRYFAALLLRDLLAKANMTHSMVKVVIERVEQLIVRITQNLSMTVQEFLNARNLLDDVETQQLLSEFSPRSPFHKMRSIKGQESTFAKYFGYIKPEVKNLPGFRYEQRLSRQGNYVQRPVRDSFIYVSLLKTIEMVLQKPAVRNFIESESASDDGTINSYRDGAHYRDHEFFQRYPNALRVELYADGLETANAMSSRRVIHKIEGFYIRIQNLPRRYQSKLGATFLSTLCYEQDLRVYGFRHVLQPLMQDLKLLESEEGVNMVVDGQIVTVRGTLTTFCGDSEAVHDLFGLMAAGANVFCRACHITRNELHTGEVFVAERRTRALHAQQLAHVQRTPRASSLYGLREDSVLNELRYFHTTECDVWDPMHDFTRGLADSVVKLILKHFIDAEHPAFTVEDLNGRILSFVYGYVDRRNRPSSNFTLDKLRDKGHELPQKAVQMWTLARSLPFLIADYVDSEDPYMKFLLLFLRIMTIVFSPRLLHDHLAVLNDLLHDYQRSRIALFPDVNPINKDHHINHYAEAMVNSGPIVNYSCFNYERFHSQIRRRAAVCCNFRHITLTTARSCQIYQCSVWSGEEPSVLRTIDNVKKPQEVAALNLEFFNLLEEQGALANDIVVLNQGMTVFGTAYRKGLFLVVDPGDRDEQEDPIFGRINQLLLLNNNPFAIVSSWVCHGLDPDFNAFRIQDDENSRRHFLLRLGTVTHYQPLNIWKPYGSSSCYLCPRHLIF